jgi:NAD(P)-dependent dehydrogenase (short-subunit alcohol dehydrogenase family)
MQKGSREKPVYKKQAQSPPGLEYKMEPQPEFDNKTWGSNKLENKKCIITGGDSGIGRAVAVAFAKQGADVAIISLPGEKEDADFTGTYIREKYHRQCIGIAADISKENNCIKTVRRIIEIYPKIDVLVNNAAVQFPAADITRITNAQLIKTFSVNIFAMFWLTKAVLPHSNKGGCIINTTSVTAYRGSGGLIDYSATKGAIGTDSSR